MEDDDLEELFGTEPCGYLSHEFVRQFLRVDLNSDEFFNEIIKYVASSNQLETQLASPSFWIKLLETFDLKYAVNGCRINATIPWISIARRFFDAFQNGKN